MEWAAVTLGVLFAVDCCVILVDYASGLALIGLILGTALCVSCAVVSSIRRPPRLFLFATIFVLLVGPVSLGWRTLPIHSMGWSGIDRVEVERIDNQNHFEVTDSQELKQLEAFGSRGTLRSMLKSGFGYKIIVWRGGAAATHFVHGDALGSAPGGAIQTIFVPSEPGFMEWFEQLLVQHGYPRR